MAHRLTTQRSFGQNEFKSTLKSLKKTSSWTIGSLRFLTLTLDVGLGLTQSFLAQHRLARFAWFTFSSNIYGSYPEGVLLLLHQALKEKLHSGDILSDTDPVSGAALQHFNDVAVDLGASIVLWLGPREEAGGFGHVLH